MVFFSALYSTPCSSRLHGFWWEVPWNFYPCSSIGKLFCIGFFQIFPLSLIFLQFEYDVTSCTHNFVWVFLFIFSLIFILLIVLWISRICSLVSVTNFIKLLTIIISRIPLLYSLIPFCHSNYMHVTRFEIVPKFLDIPFCLLILLFKRTGLSVGKFLFTFLQAHGFFPQSSSLLVNHR